MMRATNVSVLIKHPRDSYEDHSDFLRRGARYAFLFKLDITDYKGWARGLKKAGYATDPSYANRLITIIEDYDLSPSWNLPSGSMSARPNASSRLIFLDISYLFINIS